MHFCNQSGSHSAALGQPEGVPIYYLTTPLQDVPPETLPCTHKHVHGALFVTIKHLETSSAYSQVVLNPSMPGLVSLAGSSWVSAGLKDKPPDNNGTPWGQSGLLEVMLKFQFLWHQVWGIQTHLWNVNTLLCSKGHCQGWVLDSVSDRARKWAYGIFPGPRTYQGSEEGSQEPAGKLQSRWAGHLEDKIYKERVDKAPWGEYGWDRAEDSRPGAASEQLLNGKENKGATCWSLGARCFPKVILFNVRTFSLLYWDVKTNSKAAHQVSGCKYWVQDFKPGQSHPRSHCHSSLVISWPFLKVNCFASHLFSCTLVNDILDHEPKIWDWLGCPLIKFDSITTWMVWGWSSEMDGVSLERP